MEVRSKVPISGRANQRGRGMETQRAESAGSTDAVIPADEICIGGAWTLGGGEPIVVRDPADGRVLTVVHGASIDDVDRAVSAAAKAAIASGWRDMPPFKRARYLISVADAIDSSAERLALLQTLNTGKTLTETRALVASAAGTFRYFAGVLETTDDALTSPRGPYLTMSVHEPIGVVGAITPWNSPIASDAQKVAPALAAGNAVVLKPAEWTPLVALAFGRLITASGLPDGLLSVLPGRGDLVGDAIVRHPLVGKVSFTGGTTTGRTIAAIAAAKLMPVSLELGGKSPTIVLDDADIDQAVAGVLFGIFSSSGQSCIAGSRLFVDARLYDEVVGRVVDGARGLRVGRGVDPDTQVGPLVTDTHRDKVAAYVDLARAEGGQLLCGGGVPDDPALAAGSYYLPTVIEGLSNEARTCQEEIFGPVLVALPFSDEDEVIRQANQTVYGLACGLWTSDYRRAWRLAKRINAGTVWINTYKQFAISTPFGGWKESGLGREKGIAGVRAYMQQKSLYWGLDNTPLPWAAG
jgi:betaine-aldehyde dehydrogenase